MALTGSVLQEISLAAQASTERSNGATRTDKSGRPLLAAWESQHWDVSTVPEMPCRYYEDVTGVDISAIINHHAKMEDIDVNALAADLASERLNGAPSPAPMSGKAKKTSVK